MIPTIVAIALLATFDWRAAGSAGGPGPMAWHAGLLRHVSPAGQPAALRRQLDPILGVVPLAVIVFVIWRMVPRKTTSLMPVKLIEASVGPDLEVDQTWPSAALATCARVRALRRVLDRPTDCYGVDSDGGGALGPASRSGADHGPTRRYSRSPWIGEGGQSLLVLATGMTAALVVAELAVMVTNPSIVPGMVGDDYRLYMEATRRWLRAATSTRRGSSRTIHRRRLADPLPAADARPVRRRSLVLPSLLWFAIHPR